MKLRHCSLAILVALLPFAVQPAAAEVSLKNGNFFTGSKDIVFSGGFELKIERVYNSKTAFKGIFGYGWGNEYEVFLEVGGDGAVIVHEYGGGAENRFDSPTMTAAEIASAADKIAAVAKAQSDITGEQGLSDYRQRLINDAMFREDEWQKYIKKGLLQPRSLPAGTRLTSNRFSYQYITVQRDGYRRDFENGRIEFYRKDGKLRQISDKNGNFITFSYDVPGQITIRDDANRSLILSLNGRGLVARIQGSDGKLCTYSYNSLDELVDVTDTDHEEYTYEYDAAKRHNMTKISYPDKTTMLISYYPWEQFENVKSLIDRDGTLTEYAYVVDPKDAHHYTVSVKVSESPNAAGKRKQISSSTYEYLNQIKPDGEEYTGRMITVLDGDRTDTSYNINGLPTRIDHNGEVVSFEYDDHGHVTKKVEPDVTTTLTYDPVVSKVTSVTKISTETSKPIYSGQFADDSKGNVLTASSAGIPKAIKPIYSGQFTYDSKGNLLTASSAGTTVTLLYDTRGRISELDANNGNRITFEYNANSKPIKIGWLEHKDKSGKLVPTASIDVTYTDSGEIDKVDSPSGHDIALAVTSAFQELLDLIRPAGVSLSF